MQNHLFFLMNTPKNTFIGLLMVSAVITLVGCDSPAASTQKFHATQLATQNVAPMQASQETATPEDPDEGIATLDGTNILCGGEKVGSLKNGRIYMRSYDKVVSFIPPKMTNAEVPIIEEKDGFKKMRDLACHYGFSDEENQDGNWIYTGFSYLDLEASPRFYAPYGISQAIQTAEDNKKIAFACDGSLQKGLDDRTKKYSINAPYYDCSTNKKDYLTQYEFGVGAGYPIITTGGDFDEGWMKIYIKHTGSLNYIFLGELPQFPTEGEQYNEYHLNSSSLPNKAEKAKKITSKEFLDELMKDPTDMKSVALWDEMVKSFREEPAGSQI